jgi:hypothetical protein
MRAEQYSMNSSDFQPSNAQTPEVSQDAPRKRSPRIVVNGRISLGRELKLKQSPASMEVNKDGVPIESSFGHRIEYWLAEATSDEQVQIIDDGFVNGFGIFGAPGTGKSYLVGQLIEKVVNEVQTEEDKKFGGIILDPKAGMLEDVLGIWHRPQPHRINDLIVIKPDFLDDPSKLKALGIDLKGQRPALNVIDCALSPSELGKMLVLAAQSAGVSAREPFWFIAWSNLFSAVLTLLEYTESFVPTITRLLDLILLPDTLYQPLESSSLRDSEQKQERQVQTLIKKIRRSFNRCVEDAHESLGVSKEQIKNDLEASMAAIDSFFRSDYVPTIEAFIINAFGGFRQHKFRKLSKSSRPLSVKYGKAPGRPSLYDQIVEEGKILLVSIGPEDPSMGKVLCTLIKCLFQQSVMSRLERHSGGKIRNFTRPVFIACDEYAEIASEVPGQPMGDGRFFSLSRQNGCMGILATQSIHTLENSSLSESWKSIFSNLAAKIFMGAADNETAEQACDLAGQLDWEIKSTSESFGKDASFSHQRSIQQRSELTPYVLTHVLKQGQAVVLGSLDGRATPPKMRFLQVPDNREKNQAATDGSSDKGARKWKWMQ